MTLTNIEKEILSYSIPCDECSNTWHKTKDHNEVKTKEGSIEEWNLNESGRTVVYDGIVYQFYTVNDSFNDGSNLQEQFVRQIPLSKLDNLSMNEFHYDNLSPYHKKYINDPNYTFVNCCQMYIKKSQMINDECPYHQRVLSDGTLLWDEFNQDGE